MPAISFASSTAIGKTEWKGVSYASSRDAKVAIVIAKLPSQQIEACKWILSTYNHRMGPVCSRLVILDLANNLAIWNIV